MSESSHWSNLSMFVFWLVVLCSRPTSQTDASEGSDFWLWSLLSNANDDGPLLAKPCCCCYKVVALLVRWQKSSEHWIQTQIQSSGEYFSDYFIISWITFHSSSVLHNSQAPAQNSKLWLILKDCQDIYVSRFQFWASPRIFIVGGYVSRSTQGVIPDLNIFTFAQYKYFPNCEYFSRDIIDDKRWQRDEKLWEALWFFFLLFCDGDKMWKP